MKKTLQSFFLCCLHAALLCSWAAVASVEAGAVAPVQPQGGNGPGKDVPTFLLRGKVYAGLGTGLGEVIPDSAEVPVGGSQSFDIIPDYGQYIYLIRVDEQPIDMDDDNLVFSGHAATYTFSNVQQDHDLEVVFEILTYNVHALATGGGNIEPAGTLVFEHGDSQTYTMTADDEDGYELKNVLLDGVSLGAVEELHLAHIQSDHVIEAIFGLRQYPIIASAIGDGSITPAGTVTITHGLDQAFFMEADEGHHISQVMVDGDLLHPDLFTSDYIGVYTHTFTQVQGPHSISVTFSINTYEITALPNEDDFGSVLGGGTYDHGDTVELTANPEFCHYFDHWLEDGQVLVDDLGEPVGPVYEFTALEDRDLLAVFVAIEPIVLNIPDPVLVTACTEQDDIQDMFDAWVATFSFTGGYNTSDNLGDVPVLPGDVFCQGGLITFTFTVEGECYEESGGSSFTVEAPETLIWTQPDGITVDACDFEDQAGVDAAFADWLADATAQTNIGGGCDPQVSHDWDGTAPVLCDGGTVEVTWTVSDMCESVAFSATFELTAPEAIELSGPADASHLSTDFAGQAALDAAFEAWLDEFVVVEAGCAVDIPDLGEYEAPVHEEGGTVVVEFTVSDICSFDTHAAEFVLELAAFTIDAMAEPAADGTVTGAGEYIHFQAVSLLATPATGYHFVEWREDGQVVMDEGSPAGESYGFMAEEDRDLVAHFALNTYDITVQPNDPDFGTTSGGGSYSHFQLVNLSAAPETGYHFVEWRENGQVVMDGSSSAGENYSFEAEEDRDLVAHFEINTYLIEAYSRDPSLGQVSGQGIYEHFEQATLKAEPHGNYHFLYWSEGGQMIHFEPELRFMVEGARSLEAHFSVMSLHDIFVPNAFMPGSHLRDNQVFKVRFNLDPLMFRMKVFNRWGGTIFETDDFNHHWDGFVNGQEASQGTYVYQITYTDQSGKNHQKSGVVMLIR